MTTPGPQDPNASRRILARSAGRWARASLALEEVDVVDPGPPAVVPSIEVPFQLEPDGSSGGHLELAVSTGLKAFIAGGAIVIPHLVIRDFPSSAIDWAAHIELVVGLPGSRWLHGHANWHVPAGTAGTIDLGIELVSVTTDDDETPDVSWLAPAVRTAAGGAFASTLYVQGNWDN